MVDAWLKKQVVPRLALLYLDRQRQGRDGASRRFLEAARKTLSDTGAAAAEPRTERLLAPYASVVTVAVLAAAIVAVLYASNRFPEIDIAVSRMFFLEIACRPATAYVIPRTCGYFPAAYVEVLAALRQVLQFLPIVLAAGLGLSLLWRLSKGTPFFSPVMMAGGAAFWTYVLSVGLLVNMFFKEHSGRPRPHQTTLFGGEFPFADAVEWGGVCARNCSFISGEGAAGFWLLCLVPLLPRPWRPAGFIAALGLALLTGIMRIAFGAHFLSDVVVGGLATLLVFAVLSLIAVRLVVDSEPAHRVTGNGMPAPAGRE